MPEPHARTLRAPDLLSLAEGIDKFVGLVCDRLTGNGAEDAAIIVAADALRDAAVTVRFAYLREKFTAASLDAIQECLELERTGNAAAAEPARLSLVPGGG